MFLLILIGHMNTKNYLRNKLRNYYLYIIIIVMLVDCNKLINRRKF